MPPKAKKARKTVPSRPVATQKPSQLYYSIIDGVTASLRQATEDPSSPLAGMSENLIGELDVLWRLRLMQTSKFWSMQKRTDPAPPSAEQGAFSAKRDSFSFVNISRPPTYGGKELAIDASSPLSKPPSKSILDRKKSEATKLVKPTEPEKPAPQNDVEAEQDTQPAMENVESQPPAVLPTEAPAPPRRRVGRPRKIRPPTQNDTTTTLPATPTSSPSPASRTASSSLSSPSTSPIRDTERPCLEVPQTAATSIHSPPHATDIVYVPDDEEFNVIIASSNDDDNNHNLNNNNNNHTDNHNHNNHNDDDSNNNHNHDDQQQQKTQEEGEVLASPSTPRQIAKRPRQPAKAQPDLFGALGRLFARKSRVSSTIQHLRQEANRAQLEESDLDSIRSQLPQLDGRHDLSAEEDANQKSSEEEDGDEEEEDYNSRGNDSDDEELGADDDLGSEDDYVEEGDVDEDLDDLVLCRYRIAPRRRGNSLRATLLAGMMNCHGVDYLFSRAHLSLKH